MVKCAGFQFQLVLLLYGNPSTINENDIVSRIANRAFEILCLHHGKYGKNIP